MLHIGGRMAVCQENVGQPLWAVLWCLGQIVRNIEEKRRFVNVYDSSVELSQKPRKTVRSGCPKHVPLLVTSGCQGLCYASPLE